jgi:hypothetical protein
MQQGEDYRLNFRVMAEKSHAPTESWLKIRETLDTMILGTLSTSVGVVVMIVGVVTVWGLSRVEWHELVRGTSFPIFVFGIASIVGEALGLAGLALGTMRRGTISPLSAVGTVVCLGQMCLFFGQFFVMGFF